MPRLTATERMMLLLVSDSGMGKTGALASLARAGYSLRILDFDNGTQILASLLKDDPDAMQRVYVEKCTDTFKNVQGRLLPRTPLIAWTKAVNLLSNWKSDNLGPVSSWSPNDILVIDSLTHCGEAAMRYHQSLNAKLGTHPSLPDWGIVQTMMKELLELLKDSELRCQVIVITHIDWRWREIRGGKDNLQVLGRELEAGFPSAPGNKLPEKVGSYFNDALQVVATGSGTALRRKIITVPMVSLGLKSSNPTGVKREYPIESGLADYFRDVLGTHPSGAQRPISEAAE
jgi:hypothetical protein